jgi:hypothetical protein
MLLTIAACLGLAAVLAGVGAARTAEGGGALAAHAAAALSGLRRSVAAGRRYQKGLAGKVLVWGTPRQNRLLARAGSFVAYQRLDVSYRLVTAPLQVFNIRRHVARLARAG